ncbi:dolichyl-phosphate-mannose--protein mannosyltransferase [Actinokineospora spheciospongiae]|uniref:dolichyl-phosphate-mannose--protein mannosyltransferase n=1 Tax=Actinokineospora spheciospongiae TaxID=909613 RepID=UPI000D718F56|nr:phospholipid carrier-dependent glycosyltransferase [Actinokineospora spheciospongiae]PWW54934.1 dolichyl-phosphate-mannose-protein mannosyltransferase [Actinokineospora spheciospongiae]
MSAEATAERTAQPTPDPVVPPPPPAVAADPAPTDRLRGWVVAAVLGLVGGIVRFQNLGSPTDKGTPVFDEKHYTPQAWQMLRNGGVEDNPGYMLTVHPPLGKTLISLGEWLFGYSGWGWRFTAALCGTLMIIMVVRIARRLTRSTLLGAVAGLLLIADGVSHLQSRMGMLDIFLAFFVLAAFGCVLVDRDQVRARLTVAVAEGWADESGLGPRLGVRWWRLGAGALLGLACGVKWSGLYFVAAFGLLTVLFDVTARRAAGVRHPWLGALGRDVLPGLWAFVGVGATAYLTTYWGWFASETAFARHLVETGGSDPLSIAKGALGSLWQNSSKVLDFHESLVTPEKPHPWESKPWTWPMGLRPMLYYYEGGLTGCGEARCVAATMLVGTPALWWLSFPLLGWSLWRALGRFDWRYAAVLVGYLAGLLPWFANIDRQMYFFYATPMAAFLVLGLTLVLSDVLKATGRTTGRVLVGAYLVLVVANFVWLWPILNGDVITEGHWQAELWLPSWR